MGNLASVSNVPQENSELTGALYRSGAKQNVLVKDGVFLWINGLYIYNQTAQPAGSGAVCVLDILNDSRPCGSGWQLFGQSCYFSLGTTVKTRSEASTLCEREYSCSHILSLDSEAEGTYIATLAPSSRVLLDPLYSPLTDEFVGSDRQTTSYSPWAAGQGRQNLSNGRCTVLSTSSGSLQNAPCGLLNARLVCEAPKIRCSG
ncbi:snaclec coagulation factor IX/factor X-binding protein subunit B-like [Pomacea canaliculata]|uniref:snaclec coagulation factor IX/factor X-binding protein subunit B-like n=1 Tax=Pomacea canaliculata TaxID=400727 RepID=UPI000D73579D|nr:snaclec coagulation factor IX/factor X-binding protein subunit B-like [Pomacea canaliculata]